MGWGYGEVCLPIIFCNFWVSNNAYLGAFSGPSDARTVQ